MVGLILSIWRGLKKPKLSTQPVALKDTAVVRVAEMSHVDGYVWKAGATSRALQLRVECLQSVADVSAYKEFADEVVVELSKDSEALRSSLRGSQTWWPGPAKETVDEELWRFSTPNPKRRAGRSFKKRVAKNRAGMVKHDPETDADGVPGRKRRQRGKPAVKEIPFGAERFRKNQEGRRLVEQTLHRLRNLDAKMHPKKPAFDAGDRCLIPIKDVHGVAWSDVVHAAHRFFCVELLGFNPLSAHALRFKRCRNVEDWGKRVHMAFLHAEGGLKEGERGPWLSLLRGICESTHSSG